MQIAVISIHPQILDHARLSALSQLLKKIVSNSFGFSIIGLLTCHRYEIYFSAGDLKEATQILIQSIYEMMDPKEIVLKQFFGKDCFFHLSKVMSGLDSPILGESHVLNQVKQAYILASHDRNLPKELHYLFQKSLKIAKEFRSNFCDHFGKESLEKMVVEVISNQLDKNDPILLIGNSDINRSILYLLSRKGFSQIYLVSRSGSTQLGALIRTSLPYQHLSRWGEYKAVVLGTFSSQPLITEVLGPIQTKVVLDLSVPSLFQCSGLPDTVSVYNLSQLSEIVAKRQDYLTVKKEEVESEISRAVERSIALYWLKQLKQKQLFVRTRREMDIVETR